MPPVPIVDAQLHEPYLGLDWGPRRSDELTRRLFTELTLGWMKAVGVDAAVLFPTNDDAWAIEASRDHPERFCWVGRVEPDVVEVEDRIEEGAAGIRIVIGSPKADEATMRAEYDAQADTLRLAAELAVPVFLHVTSWLEIGAQAVRDHPDVLFVLDHLGLKMPPGFPGSDGFAQLPQLLALSEQPNVMVKMSGAPALSASSYPFDDIWPQLRAIVDAFGADRLMWGSDISRFEGRFGFGRPNIEVPPMYAGKHTYAESVLSFRETTYLSAAEKEKLLGGTVQRVLDWPPPRTMPGQASV
jgi:predicted TIM-barrel fold metal-dependent hydrolase